MTTHASVRPAAPLYETSIRSLPLVARGKVRDMYAVGSDRLLIITTDRLSAFDVVLDDPVPGKGQVLTSLTEFWLDHFDGQMPDHRTGADPLDVVAPLERDQVAGRSMVVKRLQPVPIEAVARGYLSGSGWQDYLDTGAVCGVGLPAGLQQSQKLAEPIFTPAAKAQVGEHDENISYSSMEQEIGATLADQIRTLTLSLYTQAASYALQRGIIIADTKFEFGLDSSNTLHLMDEVLTPDSSRFWAASAYTAGSNPPSFDKQFVRDWLLTQKWNRQAPAPRLPHDVIEQTSLKYQEAFDRLTGASHG